MPDKVKKSQVNFEEKLQELENLVLQLEKSEINLDDSIKCFEQGVKVAKECTDKLNEAEKKINIILNSESDNPKTEKFE